ncbi:hypothetical protein SDC9_90492 [bioreactor metagenome]|uniref:Uncharacterized protein n=1 Tax=bioreactor metagenome TaxID=1076179 RepID=A0A644ZSG1_9ZZZZ
MGGTRLEILGDPVFECLGLAHVDHFAGPIHHNIDAGPGRQGVRFFSQFVKGHGALLASISKPRTLAFVPSANRSSGQYIIRRRLPCKGPEKSGLSVFLDFT